MDTSQKSTEGSGVTIGEILPDAKNNLDVDLTRDCLHCKQSYNPRKSKSSLRLTYCTVMCETLDLGYHLRSLEEGNYVFMPIDKVTQVPRFSHLMPREEPTVKQTEGPEEEELILV